MQDLVNISIPTAAGTALLGYLVVFFGLVLLMIVLLWSGILNTPLTVCRGALMNGLSQISSFPYYLLQRIFG